MIVSLVFMGSRVTKSLSAYLGQNRCPFTSSHYIRWTHPFGSGYTSPALFVGVSVVLARA